MCQHRSTIPSFISPTNWFVASVFGLLLTLATAPTFGAKLIRVKDAKRQYEGKVVALGSARCSLIDRQGRLHQLQVAKLRDFETVSQRFQPESVNAFRDSLRRELGGNYEVTGTTHYLICAPQGRAADYGRLFESTYRDVERFYRVNGFQIHSPEVPLVAVVFGSQREFRQYCVKDKVPASPGLMGYYSLVSNRVALFDDDSLFASKTFRDANDGQVADASVAAYRGLTGQIANTIIHEATHQVGYNIGIHSRVGGAPLWLVEGLATVLEPDGMRHQSGRMRPEDRINDERLAWFNLQHRPSRVQGTLAKLVASDDYFNRATLDSYSESWAFSYFLLENASRRRNLVDYLRIVGEREPLSQYTPRNRLADFQKAFGDISRLEVEFIRFMDRL